MNKMATDKSSTHADIHGGGKGALSISFPGYSCLAEVQIDHSAYFTRTDTLMVIS